MIPDRVRTESNASCKGAPLITAPLVMTKPELRHWQMIVGFFERASGEGKGVVATGPTRAIAIRRWGFSRQRGTLICLSWLSIRTWRIVSPLVSRAGHDASSSFVPDLSSSVSGKPLHTNLDSGCANR